ncbi:MAG TPA: hypothetical protein VJ302_26510, partial [Blastocatellia bacterium]|nr:hypothetical protein [Blastocatellia bacterium]
MSIFLIDTDTFKKSFLSGAGTFVLKSDQNLWATLIATGGKFLPTIDRIAEIDFSFTAGRGLRLGRADGLQLSIGVDAGHQVQLIWPDRESELLKTYQLSQFLAADRLYVRLLFNAKGEFSAASGLPLGPLSGTFGIQAGGQVAYERLKVYDPERTAAEILGDLFGSLRLPQQIDVAAEIPEPGEVLITRFGGYLKLLAGLNWGYQLTGSRSIEFNQLQLDLDFGLRLMAAANIEYRLAGEFSLEARRGEREGWARFIVRQNRETPFNFTADFGFGGNPPLKGLPRSADEFLIRLIGADVEQVLGYFHQFSNYSSVAELERNLTLAIQGFIHDWAGNLIGQALSDQTLETFLKRAREVAAAYHNLDSRILDLYYAYLDRIPQLRRTLNLLTGVSDPAELIGLASDDSTAPDQLDAWEVIQLVWGASVYPLLQLNQEFAEFSRFIRQARDFLEEETTEPIRDLIARLKAAFPLDSLLEQLGRIDTPEELKSLADEKLQDLAGRLIGRAWAQIPPGELAAAVATLQAGLKKIDQFKQNWYEKLTAAVNRKFSFDLHFAYARTERDEELLDLELDLNQAPGRELAQLAALGDLREVLRRYHSSFVKIHGGVLTRSLTTSAHLHVNVTGWGYDSLKQLTQNAERSIESATGGLLHVYASETSIKQRISSGHKYKEAIESNFLFRAIGETFQPENAAGPPADRKLGEYLIQMLRGLAVQYDLLETDDRTSVDELTCYLDLGEFLGLFTQAGRAAFVAELGRQFPAG